MWWGYLVPVFEAGGAEGLLGTYLCLRQVLGVTWYLPVSEAGVGGYLVPVCLRQVVGLLGTCV